MCAPDNKKINIFMVAFLAFLAVLLMLASLSVHALVVVRMETVLGDIDVELYDDIAPLTVANFLDYVNNQGYDGSFIHRSVPGFIIQGGGYFYNGDAAEHITQNPPVQNEFQISNTRGTIAMAKLGNDPDSATSEWFFNLADNSANLDFQNGGFTVFGRVRNDGMDVVDAIAALHRINAGSPFDTLPVLEYEGVLDPLKFVYLIRVIMPRDVVSTSALDFGSIGVGASAELDVTVQNQGVNDVVLGAVAGGVQLTAPFSVVADDCSGVTLGQDAGCVVRVRFAPGTLGSVEDGFDIPTNDVDNPVLQIGLAGLGVVPLKSTPSNTLSMGGVVIATSGTQSINIENIGGVDVTVSSIEIAGTDAAEFFWAGNCLVLLAPGASCEIQVTFSPQTIDAKEALLRIHTDFPEQALIEVSLLGEGWDIPQPRIGVSSSNIELGLASLGFATSRAMTMINGGDSNLVVTSIVIEGTNAGDFSVTQDCIRVLTPGQQCVETISFAPGTLGAKSASLIIASNDPANAQAKVNLSGRTDLNRVAVEMPGGGQALFVSPFNTQIRDVIPVASMDQGEMPGGVSFDHGFYRFRLIPPQGVLNTAVAISFPEGKVPDSYYKYGKTSGNHTPHWYEFGWDAATETGAVIQGNVVTLYFVDGKRGDDDLLVNGVVVDPGAPAFLAESSPPPVDSSSSGGGCVMTTRPHALWASLDWLLLVLFVILLGVRQCLCRPGEAASPCFNTQ